MIMSSDGKPAIQTVTLRRPDITELPVLSDLCLRSKAHWGYDAAFMASCVDELTLGPNDLSDTHMVVAETDRIVGVAQVDQDGELVKLFVEPTAMGLGIGGRLFRWAVEAARETGADKMRIEADPEAAAFYERFGAVRIGEAPSGSIPGRVLPLLELALRH